VAYSKDYNNLFWFVQVSDVHIGIENDNKGKDIINFNWAMSNGLQNVNPSFIINTGDLTDATDGSEGWPWYGLNTQ
jgi:predicted MPP superfamily phosphohydrolase